MFVAYRTDATELNVEFLVNTTN